MQNPSLVQRREQLTLRDMLTADLNDVLAIERNAQLMPWGRLSFEESLTKQHICRVVEFEKTVIAFHVVCPVVDELHILNVAVNPQHQGQGIGHVLVEDIIQQANQQKSKKIFLEVRASNKVAQSLYQQWQFEQLSIRKGYYRTPNKKREDALVFVRHC